MPPIGGRHGFSWGTEVASFSEGFFGNLVSLDVGDRLEVQADVQKERCSLSGESGTVSLGTISDNASTQAMAGSILNAYMPLDR